MKQTDQLARLWVKSSDVGTLAAVAIRTSESQIVGDSFAFMLLGSDVIDLKTQRKGVLRNAAVFAPVTRALPNCTG